MEFTYDEAKAVLKSALTEQTPTQAIFECEHATIRINSRFHEPSSVSILQDGQEEKIEFPYTTIGYSYEIEHFNNLLRNGQTESDVMTFEMSRNLIKTLDNVRNLIHLEY